MRREFALPKNPEPGPGAPNFGALAAATHFLQVYRAEPMERVRLVKLGVPAKAVELVAERMAISKERLLSTLGLARATIDRKARNDQALSSEESSRLLGMVRMVGQVQAMVEESGEPQGFNAAHWLAHWLERPLPALSGRCPAEFMDTSDGQGVLSSLLARMQSGAYA